MQQQRSLIPPILTRFTRGRCGHNLNEKRGGKTLFPYFLHVMAAVSSQGENLAEERPWSCLPISLAIVMVSLGVCKWGIKELERKGVKENQQHHGAAGEGYYTPLKPHSGDPSPVKGKRRRDVRAKAS